MLHDKLEQASREEKQKRLRITFLAIAFTSVAALVLLGVIKIDLSVFGIEQGSQELKTEAETDYSSEQVSPEIERIPPPPPIEISEPPSHLDEKTSQLENSKNGEIRKAFKEALTEFEGSIEQHILGQGFENWSIDQQRQILAKKTDAISLFSTGNYEHALATLNEVIQSSVTQLEERDLNYENALSRANFSYDEDDFDTASLQISEALRLKPESTEAVELKNKINTLPKILSLIEKAAVARTENNLEKEVRYLKEVVAIAPLRVELSKRLGVVKKEIREDRFADVINSGLASIDQKQLAKAQSNLKMARSIYKDREETKLLAEKVEILQADMEVERLVGEAKLASETDDWITAGTLYQKAGKIQPNHNEVVEGYALAITINTLNNKLDSHIQASHRLSSRNVAEIVRGLIAKAGPVSARSPSILMKSNKLSKLLSEYATKVPVKVISDGATNILVRGVGRVGNTTEKTIKLRPAKYTFEGIRSGFKSKLVQVDVAPGSLNLVVEVISDERI